MSDVIWELKHPTVVWIPPGTQEAALALLRETDPSCDLVRDPTQDWDGTRLVCFRVIHV